MPSTETPINVKKQIDEISTLITNIKKVLKSKKIVMDAITTKETSDPTIKEFLASDKRRQAFSIIKALHNKLNALEKNLKDIQNHYSQINAILSEENPDFHNLATHLIKLRQKIKLISEQTDNIRQLVLPENNDYLDNGAVQTHLNTLKENISVFIQKFSLDLNKKIDITIPENEKKADTHKEKFNGNKKTEQMVHLINDLKQHASFLSEANKARDFFNIRLSNLSTQEQEDARNLDILVIDNTIEAALNKYIRRRSGSFYIYDKLNGNKRKEDMLREAKNLIFYLQEAEDTEYYNYSKYLQFLNEISNLISPAPAVSKETEDELKEILLNIERYLINKLIESECPPDIMVKLVCINLCRHSKDTATSFQHMYLGETGLWDDLDGKQPHLYTKKHHYLARIGIINTALNQLVQLGRWLRHKIPNIRFSAIVPKPSPEVGNAIANNLIDTLYLRGIDFVGAKVNDGLEKINNYRLREIDLFKQKYVAVLLPLKKNCEAIYKELNSGSITAEQANEKLQELIEYYKAYITGCITLYKGPNGLMGNKPWKSTLIKDSLAYTITEYTEKLISLTQCPLPTDAKARLDKCLDEIRELRNFIFKDNQSVMESQRAAQVAEAVQTGQDVKSEIQAQGKAVAEEENKIMRAYQTLQGNITKLLFSLKNGDLISVENSVFTGLLTQIPSGGMPIVQGFIGYADDKINGIINDIASENKRIQQDNLKAITEDIKNVDKCARILAGVVLTMFMDVIAVNKYDYNAIKENIITPFIEGFNEHIKKMADIPQGATSESILDQLVRSILENERFGSYNYAFADKNDNNSYSFYCSISSETDKGFIILPPKQESHRVSRLKEKKVDSEIKNAFIEGNKARNISWETLHKQENIPFDKKTQKTSELKNNFQTLSKKFAKNPGENINTILTRLEVKINESVSIINDENQCKTIADADAISVEANDAIREATHRIKSIKKLNGHLFTGEDSNLGLKQAFNNNIEVLASAIAKGPSPVQEIPRENIVCYKLAVVKLSNAVENLSNNDPKDSMSKIDVLIKKLNNREIKVEDFSFLEEINKLKKEIVSEENQQKSTYSVLLNRAYGKFQAYIGYSKTLDNGSNNDISQLKTDLESWCKRFNEITSGLTWLHNTELTKLDSFSKQATELEKRVTELNNTLGDKNNFSSTSYVPITATPPIAVLS